MNQIETYNLEALRRDEWAYYIVIRQRDRATWSTEDRALLRRIRHVVPAATHGGSDLAWVVITQLVEKIGRTREAQDAVWHSLAAQQYDLGYLSAPPLERLLIEQVVVDWLQLQLTQLQYTTAQTATVERGHYWERRLSAAHARYLRALQHLAQVRKLAAPTPLQSNIGGQQVNIVGSDLPPVR